MTDKQRFIRTVYEPIADKIDSDIEHYQTMADELGVSTGRVIVAALLQLKAYIKHELGVHYEIEKAETRL